MGTEFKSDGSLGDYIYGQATGHSYNAWSNVGAQHHQPFRPTIPPRPAPKPQAQTVAGTVPPVQPSSQPFAVTGGDYSGPYGLASMAADTLYAGLRKVVAAITPYLWVFAVFGALVGVWAAVHIGLSILPSTWMNLALGAVGGVAAALLSIAALGALAGVAIFVLYVIMVFSIWLLKLAAGAAVIYAVLYILSFFVPEIAESLPRW